MAKKILIIAGEASGDLYGAHLVSALRKKYPEAEFSGIGGENMRKSGVEILYPIDELAIVGVFEILSKLKVIKEAFRLLRDKIDKEKFDLAILVNYPGFNLRLAGVLKKKGIPVVFYSSPQVWAWGKWRVKGIRKFVDKMIVFMKFEEDFYRRRGVAAEFVGHPLVDIVRPRAEGLGIKRGDKKIISLLPGSRKSEVENMFPAMLKAAEIIYSKDKGVQFLVTKYPALPLEIYGRAMKKFRLPLKIIDGKTYECLNISDLAIAVSGSVTLEAAILNVPMIIVNRLSIITAIFYLIFVRLANVGLVNIIAQKRIVPELLQYNATPPKIAREAISILTDGERYQRIKKDLESVKNLAGPPGASLRAAEIISKI